jgi:parvulin-like peptidyl-prolyl isomerase
MLYLQADSKMSPDKRADLRARLEQAKRQMLADGANQREPSIIPPGFFGNLAMSYSDDQASRYKGGDIGWCDQGREAYRWPTEVITAGMALSKGGISDVIETAKGLFLVAKTDSREPVVTPLEKMDATLRRQLTVTKRQETEQVFMKQLRAAVPVQIQTAALASINLPAVTTAKVEVAQPPAFP